MEDILYGLYENGYDVATQILEQSVEVSIIRMENEEEVIVQQADSIENAILKIIVKLLDSKKMTH